MAPAPSGPNTDRARSRLPGVIDALRRWRAAGAYDELASSWEDVADHPDVQKRAQHASSPTGLRGEIAASEPAGAVGRPALAPHPKSRSNLAERLASPASDRSTVLAMDGPHRYGVTMVRPSHGLPLFEVGAYEYVAEQLPYVGETIPLRKVVDPAGGGEVRGYVTRVDPSAGTPISVTEIVAPEPTLTTDDVLV